MLTMRCWYPVRGPGAASRGGGGQNVRWDWHPGQQRQRHKPDGNAADKHEEIRSHDEHQRQGNVSVVSTIQQRQCHQSDGNATDKHEEIRSHDEHQRQGNVTQQKGGTLTAGERISGEYILWLHSKKAEHQRQGNVSVVSTNFGYTAKRRNINGRGTYLWWVHTLATQQKGGTSTAEERISGEYILWPVP